MTDQETKSKKDTVSKDQVAKAAAQLETEAAEMAELQKLQTQQIRWRKPKQ
jgi:hypothetical protein